MVYKSNLFLNLNQSPKTKIMNRFSILTFILIQNHVLQTESLNPQIPKPANEPKSLKLPNRVRVSGSVWRGLTKKEGVNREKKKKESESLKTQIACIF